jgi:hypothetical protein
MTIWALFDSETCGVAKALPEHEVYSFGIGGGTEHVHLDLGDFEAAKTELDKYPKPDVIFASPPCESWVSVSKGNIGKFTTEKGINLHWKERWVPFDFKPEYKKTRLNGIATALCTAQIILYYEPQFWAIENGKSSLLFDFLFYELDFIGNKNECNYYSYGFEYLKPTIIYSNLYMPSLKDIKPKRALPYSVEGGKKRKSGYSKNMTTKETCRVPPLLYKDIMRQFTAALTKEEESCATA